MIRSDRSLPADDGASRRRAVYYWANDAFMGLRIAEFKLMVKDEVVQQDNTLPRLSPFQGTAQPLLCGGNCSISWWTRRRSTRCSS